MAHSTKWEDIRHIKQFITMKMNMSACSTLYFTWNF